MESLLAELEQGLFYLVANIASRKACDIDSREEFNIGLKQEGGKVQEVLDGWVKGRQYKDTARNMAILRIFKHGNN